MARTRTPNDPAWLAANRLVDWLKATAADEPLFLPGLRADSLSLPGRYRGRHTRAGEIVFAHADREGHGEVYRGVARLFAHYYRAPHNQLRLGFGSGSMGAALARLSQTEHAPKNGRSLLYLDACSRSRTRLPWRELTKACETLRDRKVAPPDWRVLVVDLTDWHRPRNPRLLELTVRESWFTDFHAAHSRRPRP